MIEDIDVQFFVDFSPSAGVAFAGSTEIDCALPICQVELVAEPCAFVHQRALTAVGSMASWRIPKACACLRAATRATWTAPAQASHAGSSHAVRASLANVAGVRSVCNGASRVGGSWRAMSSLHRPVSPAHHGVPAADVTGADPTPVVGAHQARMFAAWTRTEGVQAAHGSVAPQQEADGAGYKLVDAEFEDFGTDDAADGSGETAWFTKRNIEGSTKKLNLLAKQVRALAQYRRCLPAAVACL